MKKILCAMYLMCGIAMGAPLEPIKLKGMAPGMTLEELEQVVPNFIAACSPTADKTLASPDDERCSYFRPRYNNPVIETFHTFADAPVTAWSFYGRESRLHSILVVFDAENYAAIYKALTAKYGSAKISSQII